MMTPPKVDRVLKKDLKRKAVVDQEVKDLMAVVQAAALMKKVDQDQVLTVRKVAVVDQMMTQTKTQTMAVTMTVMSQIKTKKAKAKVNNSKLFKVTQLRPTMML